MANNALDTVIEANIVEELSKEMEADKSDVNVTKFLEAAIFSKDDAHVRNAVDIIGGLINSDAENKPRLYYQLGVAQNRLKNPDSAKPALLQCLELDSSFPEARKLLERISAGEGSSGSKSVKGDSTMLITAAGCVGLAAGMGSVLASSSATLNETLGKHTNPASDDLASMMLSFLMSTNSTVKKTVDGLKKAAQLGDTVEKRIATDSAVDVAIATGFLGIVFAALYVAIKKKA